jgi:hypothetical protein
MRRSADDHFREKGTPVEPTLYAGVNTALNILLTGARDILGERFIGLYLIGSLALGDFSPQRSDIDYMVVTDSAVEEHHFMALQAMHARFDASGSPWAARIEAVYVPRNVLKHPDPVPEYYPQIETGRALFKEPLEVGWVFQRHTLRAHGVIVEGPDPHDFLGPSATGDLQSAVTTVLQPWMAQRRDPEWLAWLRAGGQPFVVLTLCRLLYSFTVGDVASKPAAAHWAQQALGERWHALIERAVIGQHDNDGERDEQETVALLEYTAERCR